MSLIKSKQIDVPDLSMSLYNFISSTPMALALWRSLFVSGVFLTAVFSIANSTLVNGQTNLSITTPMDSEDVQTIFVFRNGAKLIEDVDYTTSTPSTNVLTITLLEAVGASSGSTLDETIEINYY